MVKSCGISREIDSESEHMAKEDIEKAVIVVGLDGSDSSTKALRWAVEEARLRGGVVKAVRAWELPLQPYESYIPPEIYLDAAKDAEVNLEDQLAKVLGKNPPVEISREIHEGDPAMVIMDQADGAKMIVVGSRGLGGFSGVLLGSVSSRLVHHARCLVSNDVLRI